MRRAMIAIIGMSGCLAIGSARGAGPSEAVPGAWEADSGHRIEDFLAEGARILKGFQIAPVPLNLKGKNPALVGLGSYLVNAQGGCNDCHTHPSYAPGGDPYLGQPTQINTEQYLSGGRQFGPITSRNLTPGLTTGLPAGDLTVEKFLEIMHKGTDVDKPGSLLQVMPWPVYSNMTARDLRAIYEYLRAIPSLPDNPNPGP